MSSAVASKRVLLAEDVPWRASPAGTKPVPRIHQNPILRLPQNPNSGYALRVMKHPNPIGEGFATEARLEAAGPECIVPGQVSPVRILGLKIWPIDINFKFIEPIGRELQALGKDWRCNKRSYAAYRNFIRRPRNWESQITQSYLSTSSHSGHWASPQGSPSILFDTESQSSSRDLRGFNLSFGHRSSFSSNDADHHFGLVEPAYSFVGMHCIFDTCKASVTILKFGHMSSDLLAYGASDGSLTVCHVSKAPSIIEHLKGHSKAITDFDFSSNNQYIASSSVDKTVMVWEISKGHCIRVIYGTSSQLCIRFHPVNNNLLLVGNANKEISMINFSTGRVIKKVYFEKELTAMDNDHTGQLIFCGDAQGCIYTVSVNSHTGSMSRSHKNRSMRSKSPITTVQYRTFSLVARCPVLLVCAQDGNLCFFSVALEIQGYLTLLCSLKLSPRLHSIRASFCPLLSLEKGEFIVAGSEDSNVYFYDLTRPKHACVNKLQGHASPVIGVAWNHGENLLASSDSEGTVIVWKRAKTS